jgi:Predicted transcription regulator containing HTH domain
MRNKRQQRRYPNLRAYLEALDERGITQAEFAADFGISPSHLSDIKNGARGASLKLAKQLADRCGVPIESFVLADHEQRVS